VSAREKEIAASGRAALTFAAATAYLVQRQLLKGTSMRTLIVPVLTRTLLASCLVDAQKYTDANGRLRVALAKQPFLPNGISPGPNTMADGGIQEVLSRMGPTREPTIPRGAQFRSVLPVRSLSGSCWATQRAIDSYVCNIRTSSP